MPPPHALWNWGKNNRLCRTPEKEKGAGETLRLFDWAWGRPGSHSYAALFTPPNFADIRCFIKLNLLGQGKLAPRRRPAFSAETAAVISAPLAVMAIITGMFLVLLFPVPRFQ
jgi:hypothetical protein